MAEPYNRRPSEWRRLFGIACNLLDQVRDRTGGYPFQWPFGGGTAMVIQIGHRESPDIDIFIDDAQILGFLDPAKLDLEFKDVPASYEGDGAVPEVRLRRRGGDRLHRCGSADQGYEVWLEDVAQEGTAWARLHVSMATSMLNR